MKFNKTDFIDLKLRAERKNGNGSAEISAAQLLMLTMEIDRLKVENDQLREALRLTLSFCPRDTPSEGLCPMFYHTLSYEGEIQLMVRLDAARAMLKEIPL